MKNDLAARRNFRHIAAIEAGRARRFALHLVTALSLLWLAAPLAGAATAQQSFATPQAAASALAEAVRAADQPALRAIFGAGGSKLIRSGDPIADEQDRRTFLQKYDEGNRIAADDDGRAELLIGKDSWPMPIPLRKGADGNWRFDTRAGEEEILARRIGRNELAAIQVCLAIVEAEREFVARDSDGDGLHEYAPRITSRPGKRDGLYWPTGDSEPQSPLGPLLAAAAQDGYPSTDTGSLQPYHGYLFKILTEQGKDAPGGAYKYFVGGKMIAGFGVIAYPARHGASGLMSFIVNQNGVVYQKNLGAHTVAIAAHLKTFHPDASWRRVAAQTP